MTMHMVYNGTTLTIIITDTMTKVSFSKSWTINVASTVGADNAVGG
jgi:hypothetical protein